MYKTSKIYKVKCKYESEGECYIGSTTQSLALRMGHHRQNYRNYQRGIYHFVSIFSLFDMYGVENCEITLIEDYPCERKEHLTARERHHIQNTSCVNKNIPGRGSQEWHRNYYESNKEHKLEYAKQYREVNKEKVLLQHKHYRELS